MRIVVWGINYAPEVTGIAPYNTMLCEFLHNRGHQVSMLTSFSYYPAWRKREEDQGRGFRTDTINGVPVHRCWQYVPSRVRALKRILHEASFVLTSSLRLLTLSSPDVLVVVSPPLLLGLAAAVTGALRGIPFVFHVQDLQPDAAVGLGMLKPGLLTRALFALEGLGYRMAARVSGITRGMLRAFERKGVPEKKRVYFPNGVALSPTMDGPSLGKFRARQGIDADTFVAVYSGNLGVKQGLSVLLEAAALSRDPRIQWVICGDGAEREKLEEQMTRQGILNIRFLPLQEQTEYQEMLADADLCLITQQAGSGRFFFPSKLLTALAYGKPVLAVVDADSDLEEAIREGEFGYCIPTNDPAEVALALQQAASDRESLAKMGARGRRFVQRFDKTLVLMDFEKVLREVANEPRGFFRSKK